MIPTHGAVSGVFLLAHAARNRNHEDLDAWIRTARDKSSYMARAVDLDGYAHEILRIGLAEMSDVLRIDRELHNLAVRADRPSFMAISSLLLMRDSPHWIAQAVRDGRVFREFIPSDALRDMEWLEPFLDQLIVEVAARLDCYHLESLREALGRAGELVVLAAAEGACALHVADLSNSYGYDIEIQTTPTQRLEIKSTTKANKGSFHLSRNEFDKCRYYGNEWRLVQVIFDSSVFTDDSIAASHVLAIRELAGSELLLLVPPDSGTFRWTDSAVIHPPIDAWQNSTFKVPAGLHLPGIREISSSFDGHIA